MYRCLFYLALACCSLPLWSQCKFANKQADPQPAKVLPAATREGMGTAGFLVNDSLWLPQGSLNRERLGGYYRYGSLAIFGNYSEGFFESKNQQGFGLTIGDARSGPGTYLLGEVPLTNKGNYAVFHRKGKVYETNAQHSGVLVITRLDSVQRIVSGEFHFTPVDISGETVRITTGRFDLQY